VIALALALFAAIAQAPNESRDARLERWRESLELDLAGEVAAEAALVETSGPLARDADAIALVARALAQRGDEERALLLLDRPEVPDEKRGPLELERARILIGRDELDQAAKLLLDPAGKSLRRAELADAHLLLGRVRAREGRLADAKPHLERFLELSPLSADAPAAWHMLAEEALGRRDGERARFCADREQALGRWHSYYRARRVQIRAKPNEPLPRLGLAQQWLEVGDFAKARKVAEELVALAPTFCRGWFALGEAQRKQEDLTAALASYSRALECDPTLHLARYNRAVIARLQSRDADARADFEVLVEGEPGRDPKLAGAHLELARILLRAGDRDAALARYAIYRERGGKDPLEPTAPRDK
jgi:tetratricopeptide (TPR) repeat protein